MDEKEKEEELKGSLVVAIPYQIISRLSNQPPRAGLSIVPFLGYHFLGQPGLFLSSE